MKKLRSLLSLALVLVFLLGLCPAAFAADWPERDPSTNYDNDAVLDADNPGVYIVKPAKEGTIGIPSIADKNLENKPTTESPAIIRGAAVPFETRDSGPVAPDMFKLIDESKPVTVPYKYFRPAIVEEANTSASVDPNGKHYKMSGFDGTYVILRIDVTDLVSNLTGEGPFYLHMKETNNKAMLVAIGEDTTLFDAKGEPTNAAFDYGVFVASSAATQGGAALGSRTASFALENAQLKYKDGLTPYVDVILLTAGSLVAGGDVSAAEQGDVNISFYVDNKSFYPEEIPSEAIPGVEGKHTTEESYAKLTALVQAAAAAQPSGSGSGSSSQTTTVTLDSLYLKKYFNDAQTGAVNYTIKGSDLALEVMMEKGTSQQADDATEYWSMAKALTHTYYDGVTTEKTGAIIKLMSEVPVVKGLNLEGSSADNLKKRTLDVNTFDIQIADNTSGTSSQAGLTLKNAWLELMDSNTTTGSELAIGNNASMVIDAGGKLIIDKDGQLEVEYDAASQAASQGQEQGQSQSQPASQPINNGVLTIKQGGEIENNGVITIEGTEAKEIDPTVNASTQPTGKGQIVNRGILTNNGCISINGEFYNVGTLINNGKYADVIESNDPDKGKFTYHKGIQLSWKDDVTQSGSQTSGGTTIEIRPGMLLNGYDPESKGLLAESTLTNNGDFVCAPGVLYNFGVFQNKADATVNLGVAVKAVIPIIPTAEAPTIVTKDKILAEPVGSAFLNAYSWEEQKGTAVPAVIENDGTITTAIVDVPNNGVLGEIHAPAYLDVSSYDIIGSSHLRHLVQFDNYGFLYLGSSGKLVLPLERNFNNEMPAVILNCDSAVLDETAHSGQIMTKNATTTGGEATLTNGDVTMAYTTFATSGPAFLAEPASVRAGETVTLSGKLSSWSPDTILTAEGAPALAVNGTGYSKDLPCDNVTKDGDFYVFNYSDSFSPSSSGTHTYKADVDSRGFITAEANVTVQQRSSGGGGGSGGTTAVTNPVTIPDAAAAKASNGSVKASASNAKAGDKVTLTLTPDEGYQAAGVTVTDKNGKNVPVTKNEDGTYSFTMPSTAVTVTPVFEKAGETPEQPGQTSSGGDRFTDVSPDAWYKDAVDWAVDKGIMNGMSETIFAPDSSCTRAMVVTMLWRLAGQPAADADAPFTDVSDGAWYADAVAWAAQTGAVKGTSDTTFSPDTPVTREQLAAILYRYAQAQGKGFTGTWAFPLDFSDAANVSEYAYEPLCWMTMNNIITGMGDGTLAPQDNATRAQIAAMFMRFAETMAQDEAN